MFLTGVLKGVARVNPTSTFLIWEIAFGILLELGLTLVSLPNLSIQRIQKTATAKGGSKW